MKDVRIRSFSGPYFPTFGLNMERYQSEWGKNKPEKLRIRMDTFHAVSRFLIYELLFPKANEETFGETNQKALLRRSERILGPLKKYIIHENSLQLYFNPLSANPTKWSNTLKQLDLMIEHIYSEVISIFIIRRF